MLSVQERTALFIGGCIPLRVGLTTLAYKASPDTLRYMGFLALIPAIVMLLLWATDSRLNATEAGGNTWWHQQRVIHSLIWFIFAFAAINASPHAWKALAVDTAFGLSLFINNRTTQCKT